MTALELFKASLKADSRVCLIGGTPEEYKALSDYSVTTHSYAATGVKYEAAPQRPEMYDGIYCAHTLEHMRNVGSALDKMYSELKDNGLLCLVVPPAKHNIVGGHLTLWNAGLLVYNLIRAHFDCSKAAIRTYDYNVAILVRKRRADYDERTLKEDNGDIETLAPYFPVPAHQDMDGRWAVHSWSPR